MDEKWKCQKEGVFLKGLMVVELEGWEGRRDVIFSLCGSMKEKGEMSSQGVEKGADCRGMHVDLMWVKMRVGKR